MEPAVKVELRIKGLVFDPDRNGNPRYYFRRRGHNKIRIHSQPGTDAFREEVRCAELGIPFAVARVVPVKPSIAARRGSLKWLCLEYIRRNRDGWSTGYASRVDAILKEICDGTCLSSTGIRNGDLTYSGMQLKHVAQLRDEKAAAPTMANRRVKNLSAMFNWAIGAGLAQTNPAEKCAKLKIGGTGFHTWTIDEIEKFLERHPAGTKPNTALHLFLFTGLRRGDIRVLNRRHIYESAGERRIRMTPNKTRKSSAVVVDIPLLPELATVIDALPRTQLTFLESQDGKPYSDAGLGNAMRDWCDQAGLPHCTAHGLRKAGAVIAAEGGATNDQLKAIFGWTTDQQAALYTRDASRKKLASDGAKLISIDPR